MGIGGGRQTPRRPRRNRRRVPEGARNEQGDSLRRTPFSYGQAAEEFVLCSGENGTRKTEEQDLRP